MTKYTTELLCCAACGATWLHTDTEHWPNACYACYSSCKCLEKDLSPEMVKIMQKVVPHVDRRR